MSLQDLTLSEVSQALRDKRQTIPFKMRHPEKSDLDRQKASGWRSEGKGD